MIENNRSPNEIAQALIAGAAQVIHGKQDFLELLVACALAKGHVLIDDLPGLGKTTVAKAFSQLICNDDGKSLHCKRIQFTPDLLPYDITGVDVYDPNSKAFSFVPGPIFANIVLADEINRSTPKVQSALLEVMAENQVSIGLTTHPVNSPFLVIATQNPVESEGTFPLPAAQLDRFMACLSLGYPDRNSELAILKEDPSVLILPTLSSVITKTEFERAQHGVDSIFCDQKIYDAVIDIVRTTRSVKAIAMGASPRAALHFLKLSKAFALVQGRTFITDEDLAAVAVPVLAHRIKLRDPRLRAETLVQEVALARIEQIPKG